MPRKLPARVRRGLRRRHTTDRIARGIFTAMAAFVALVVAALLGYILIHGIQAVSWQFLTSAPNENAAGGGIGPELYNSFYILLLTLFFTVPIAVAAAMYMEEYAPSGIWTRAMSFASEVLSTVPSIVMGLFGLLLFVYILRWRFSAIGGALTLTLLNLPAMMRVAGLAIDSVPRASREASLALGATRWYTLRNVVLPAAAGQLISGIVLIAGRIFGETAALVYTAGVSIEPAAPYSLSIFHPAETLSVHLWYTHSESIVPDVARVGDGAAFVLVLMVLFFNLGARGLGNLLTRGRATR
jgi:phosphate transport system permease protein